MRAEVESWKGRWTHTAVGGGRGKDGLWRRPSTENRGRQARTTAETAKHGRRGPLRADDGGGGRGQKAEDEHGRQQGGSSRAWTTAAAAVPER